MPWHEKRTEDGHWDDDDRENRDDDPFRVVNAVRGCNPGRCFNPSSRDVFS